MTPGNPGKPKGLAVIGAIIGSFALYLVPIPGVHTGFSPLGIFLLAAFYGLSGGEIALSLASIVFALVFQSLLALILFWTLRGFRWWKGVVFLLAVPVLAAGLGAGLLLGIPALFLLERDPAVEVGALQEVCRVPGVYLLQANAGVAGSLEENTVAWIGTRKNNQWDLLSMPDCRVRQVGQVKTTSVAHVTARGDVLYRSYKDGFFHLSPGQAPVPVVQPDLTIGPQSWQPLLSDDGSTLVWLDRAAGPSEKGKVRGHVLRLRRFGSENIDTVELDLPPRDQLTLIGADVAAGRFTLNRYRNEFLAVDGEGRVVWGPLSPNGTYSPRFAFRRIGDGWLAWDSYRENGRHLVRWALAGGKGGLDVPKGRTIEHVSVDPSGRFAAVSVRGSARLVSLSSALVVLRLSDDKEIYRRFGEPYQRFWPAFLGSGHLAVSGFKDGQAKVVVYRLPVAR